MIDAKRKLLAILAADVVGYSRLMADDDRATMDMLGVCRGVFRKHIAAHEGRVVDTAGDSVLATFPSVVEAVACAIATQHELDQCNTDLAVHRQMRFRIGVNLGDVFEQSDGSLYGDGVNIAARLEGLAEPGGITISEDAHRQVSGKIDLGFQDLGAQQVKNIPNPVRAFRVVGPGTGKAPIQQPPTATALTEKPSIAVLPFDNLSADPEQEYFADGMTEDLITDLSKIAGLFVVARNSSSAYKGKALDVRTLASDLGVRYVLEGSIRKVGERVRINAQLIDAASGGHLWAERYNGTVNDVFELQDEVCAKVVSALYVQLSEGEHDRLQRVHTHNLDAYESYVRAKAIPYPPIPSRIEEARLLFSKVAQMDPNFAGGYAGESLMLSLGLLFSDKDNTGEDLSRALLLAEKGVEVDESFGLSYVSLGLAHLLRRQFSDAIVAGQQAIERQPNDALAHAYLGMILAASGRPQEGLESIDKALRLDPQFVNGPYLNLLCLVHVIAQNYQAAAQAFELNIKRQGPVGPPILCAAVAIYTALGRTEDAERLNHRLRTEFAQFSPGIWGFVGRLAIPEVRERFRGLLQRAGVPE